MVPEGLAAALIQVSSRFTPFQRSGARFHQAVRDAFLVIAALALLGAQALSTLHFVLVPHHLCALHGVLEDGGTGAKARAHDATRDTANVEANAPSEQQDEHDVCSVATRNEHAVLLQEAALSPTTLGEADVVGASRGISLELTRAALLSQAPKTSPPVRA